MTAQEEHPPWLMPWQSFAALSTVTVARSLSRICRFSGRPPHWYSVARHSRLVVHLLPVEATLTQRKWALLHDAHEMFIGDLPRPFEESLTESARLQIANIRDEIDTRIQSLMGVTVSDADRDTVQVADNHACELEKTLLHLPDSAIYDQLPDSPEAAYELTVIGRPELDAADWRQMWEAFSSESQ
jgi:hypothetical protein